MARTQRLDAGLYRTADGRATVESQERILDGEHSDYGSDGWLLTVDGDPATVEIHDTKHDALDAYATGLAAGLWATPKED